MRMLVMPILNGQLVMPILSGQLQFVNPLILSCPSLCQYSRARLSSRMFISGAKQSIGVRRRVRVVTVLTFPVFEAEKHAGVYTEEGLGLAIELELDETVMIFPRRAIFQRDFRSGTSVDYRGGGADRWLDCGHILP